MASRVSGVETKPVRIAPGTAVHKRTGEPAGEAGSGAAAGTDVHITGAARGLAAIEQGVRELPAVDEARVAAVRKRLDDGSYRLDPQRVADRLLHLEREMSRSNPVEGSAVK